MEFITYFLFSPIEYFGMFFAVLYGMTIRSATGFGGISITLPILLLFDSNPLIFTPILVLQAVFIFASNVYQERLQYDYTLIKPLFIPIILFYIIGVFGFFEFSAYWYSIILGISALLLGLVFGFLKFKKSTTPKHDTFKLSLSDYILLACSGYFGGIALSGGIFLTSVLLRNNINKNTFRFILSLSGLLFTLPKLIVFIGSFMFAWYVIPIDLGFIIISSLATFIAIPLGAYLSKRVSQSIFDYIVIIVLIITGLSLLIKANFQ